MKDENSGIIMLEFIGLHAKPYTLRIMNGCLAKTAKGVKGFIFIK